MKKTLHMEHFTQSHGFHSKFHFKILLSLFLLLIIFTQSALANGGIGYKGVYINNKGTKSWYKAHNVAWGYSGCTDFSFNGAADFSGQNFGSLTSSETLQIAGFAVVGWTDGSDWVAGKLLYKVWKQGDSEPGWSEIYIGNYGNGNGASQVVCLSGSDRIVGYNNGITNINPGAPGTYNLKLQALGRMQWSGGFFNVNDGSEVTATFTITSSTTDYFRSKTTGNWNTASSWESSSNTTNWATSTLVPGNSASGITILNGHSITLDANVSVSGLTINSGATFTASDATARTLTISKSASGSSTTLANNGTWANGTGGSTVVFSGAPSSGDAIHAITGAIAFQNITVNKTGGSSNIGASFGANSSLTGTLEIGTGGFISTAPPTSFYSSGAVLKFNQGVGATYDVNTSDYTWSTSVIPNNITIQSGTVNVNSNRIASGDLIITSGAILNVSAGKQLTISSSLSNNGALNLKSTSANGTATIITPDAITGSGSTVVEQYLSSTQTGANGRNWYISSPLSAATSSTITSATGNALVYYSAPSWPNAGTTLDVMKGYIAVSPAQNTTIQFTGGTLNTGDKSVTNLPLGFNLVGNPYASFVDWTQATKSNVSTSIWYRSKSTGTYLFQTYNVTGGIGTNGGTNIIPPMQSFWIKTTNATNSLGFTNSMRSHQDMGTSTNRLKTPAVNTQKLLRLEVLSGVDKDETVVYFNENALNTFDEYDSQKMFNDIAGSAEIYTFTDNKNLVINGLNTIQLDTEIPLGFRTGITDANYTYTLKASQLQNFGTDTELVLIDKNNSNLETVMNEGSEYSFTSAAVNSTNRFSLVFKAKGTTTGGCCYGTFENKITVNKGLNNSLIINCSNESVNRSVLTIYNLAGQKQFEQAINGSVTIQNTSFKPGVYLVKLNSEGKTNTIKITL